MIGMERFAPGITFRIARLRTRECQMWKNNEHTQLWKNLKCEAVHPLTPSRRTYPKTHECSPDRPSSTSKLAMGRSQEDFYSADQSFHDFSVNIRQAVISPLVFVSK